MDLSRYLLMGKEEVSLLDITTSILSVISTEKNVPKIDYISTNRDGEDEIYQQQFFVAAEKTFIEHLLLNKIENLQISSSRNGVTEIKNGIPDLSIFLSEKKIDGKKKTKILVQQVPMSYYKLHNIRRPT